MSTVYNPGKSPVYLDDEGHFLGGQERRDVSDSDRVRDLLDKGLLIEVAADGEQDTAATTKEG